jgi:isochorismate hydrolase
MFDKTACSLYAVLLFTDNTKGGAMQLINDIALSNLAVLLIDMQKDFVTRPEKFDLIPNQVAVLRFCRERYLPVVWIEYDESGETMPELVVELNKIPPGKLYFVSKGSANAFIETDLGEMLRSINATDLIIMGVNACACVYETAVEAHRQGYQIITSENLVAGYCSKCLPERRNEWYEKNGVYVKDHNHILSQLSER